MNQRKKWVERNGKIVRHRRSLASRDWRSFPHADRNVLNRRIRRHDAQRLHHCRWDDFHNRLMHDAEWYY